MKNKKHKELENKLYELIDGKRNIAVNWYALGENFIQWDINPMKKENFTNEFYLWCQLLANTMAKTVKFYCCPDAMYMNGWIRISFMF